MSLGSRRSRGSKRAAKEQQYAPTSEQAPSRRLMFILNPHGGNGRAKKVLEKCKGVFEKAEIEMEVVFTERKAHALDIVRELPNPEDYAGIVAVGGDGTFHEVVNGLMTRTDGKTVHIGLLPGGTGNSVAMSLGMYDPLVAAERLAKLEPKPFDVVEMTHKDQTTYCVNIVAWGLTADIGFRAEGYRFLGTARYDVAAAIEVLRLKKRKCRMVVDGEEYEGPMLLWLMLNTIYAGHGMMLSPPAKIDDGKMDLVYLEETSRGHALKLLTKIKKGTHIEDKKVTHKYVERMELYPEVDEELLIDGETGIPTPVTFLARPAAFQLLH